MSIPVDFGNMEAAKAARDDYSEYVCPADDDKRMKTVHFVSDTPDRTLESIRLAAEDSQGTSSEEFGQVPIGEAELQHFDFSVDGMNVPRVKTMKAPFSEFGITGWTQHVSGDEVLTQNEAADLARSLNKQIQDGRVDLEDDPVEQSSDAAQTAQDEECDHAAGHCANGDPDACEFIREQCGMDPDRVLARREPEPPEIPEKPAAVDGGEEITGEAAGAMKRAWQGYNGAMAAVDDALAELREEWENAQQAGNAINEIRADHGQPPLHFENLEAAQADLMDLLRKMAADCTECHAAHGDHGHDTDSGDVEDIRVVVTDGASQTPVGTSEETEAAAEASNP